MRSDDATRAVSPPQVRNECTRETGRCEFWTWGPEYLRPDCCTRHLQALLFFTDELLTRHGITHWLDWGSLLGAVRHRAFIPWDSDVDWGVLKTDLEKIHALEPEIAQAGYRLDTRDPYVWRINYSPVNTQHVDLYPWWEESGLLRLSWPTSSPDRWAFPLRYFTNLESVSLYDRAFPAPSPVHEFLAEHRYGPDYMTPQRPPPCTVPDSARGTIEHTVRSFVAQRRQVARFQDNLDLLHDLLQATPLAERYWVIGGLLIGWAREGRILPHDPRDADFGFWRQDHDRFLAAIPHLVRGGFQPLYRWVNNAVRPVEYSFTKDGGKFEFFEHERLGSTVRCFCFGTLTQGQEAVRMEFVRLVPAFTLAPMDFLGRTWQKPADHEAFLTGIYGDWRTPNPDYEYTRDDLSIVKARVWTGSYHWPLCDRPTHSVFPGEPRP